MSRTKPSYSLTVQNMGRTVCVQGTKHHSSREGWGCEPSALCMHKSEPSSPAWKEDWPNWPKQKAKTEIVK